MRRRLESMKTSASNRQVAQVLETAKGTIDAQLFALKGKWENYDESAGDEDAYNGKDDSQ